MTITIKKILEKLHLVYRGKSVFTKFYWSTWLDRRKHGFDITDTWNLDYTFAKFIVPRLLAFTNCLVNKDYPTGCPVSVIETVVAKYKGKGYKYKGNYEFVKEEINKKVEDEANSMWFQIVDTITVGFQDFLLEDEDFNEWKTSWEIVLESINTKVKKLKTKAEKTKILNEYNISYFDYVANKVNIYYLSQALRKKSLKLLSQYFYDLWW